MSEPLVRRLGEFVAVHRERGLPPALIADAKRRLLDLVGNSLAALDAPAAEAVRAVVVRRDERGEASVIGSGARRGAATAALVNGTLAHALDFDDTHLPSVLHPSASVIPAALATAEATGRSGGETLAAIALGDELNVRLGSVGYDAGQGVNLFFEHGLHATSICGALAAAGTTACLLGLAADEVAHAIAIAASMGAGLLEANRTGGSVKRIHCGFAAHCGVTAGELAAAGLTGPPTVLEGRFGFFQAYCGPDAALDALVDGLGERWEVLSVFFKPYPCNHFTHPGVDAALTLRAQGLDPREIVSAELGLPSSVLRTVAEPREEKIRPESGYHAAFSGPFTVASALIGGGGLGLYLDDFTDERARDPERLELAARVECVPDAECDRIFPQRFPARLRVRTRSGDVREVFVASSRGGPENPLTESELDRKFELNAFRHLPQAQVCEIRRLVHELDRLPSPAPLLEATASRTTLSRAD
jgi:2-methylcitrate dehydratase PrpD